MTNEVAQTFTRGRPLGQELVAQSRGLRLHDLALLRALANGMDMKAAAKRYLPELQADQRIVRGHVLGVLREAQAHLVGLSEPELGQALATALQACLGEQQPEPAAVDSPPTLEEFAQRFDDGMLSEKELAEMYAEEFGDRVAPAFAPRRAETLDAALRGLAVVQSRCVQEPRPDDALSLWLSPRLCAQLRPLGVLRLAELVTLVNRLGRTWWRAVPGLGRGRAMRLVQWLIDHQACLAVSLSARVVGGSAAATEVVAVAAGLPSLRRAGVNALGAGSDAEAVQAWLASLTLKSPHTLKAYRRDVERLVLWARERGKGLSTLVVQDAVEHVQFLLDPPAHWINPLPAARAMADWRPMRGPLSVASANRALAAVAHLYGFLLESGYLVANPFARVRSVAATKAASVRLDTTRSFSAAHLAVIEATLAAMADDMAKRRLQAILSLAETTGLRIAELVGHTWGDVRSLPDLLDDVGQPVYGLTVVGKGNRERTVPLRASVLQALQRHRMDRAALAAQGVVPEAPEQQIPLLSVIDRGLKQRPAEDLGHLSGAGIHRQLKQFFRRVAHHCETEALRADLVRASCHWLRHTFAHEVLKASGNDLPVTQQLLDHRSISTTGQYLKADMTQRVQAVLALPERFQ